MRHVAISGIVGALVLAYGCGGAHPPGHAGPIMAAIADAEGPNENGGLSTAGMLRGEALERVEGHPDVHEFFVRSRDGKIEKTPCEQCHKVPLARMKHDGKDGKPAAHWAVELKHAPAHVMNCRTCHLEDSMDKLKTLTAAPVSYQQSHQLCAQCHSKEAADWAGGAHGKRVAGWAPPRVAQTCVECHDPHQPAFTSRLPARAAATQGR
jgi:hypothetical protein